MIVRLSLSFVVFTCLCLAQTAFASDTYALLVGVGKYQNEHLISSLRFPAVDATSMRDALTDAQLGGLPTGNARLLTDSDATKANIWAAFDEFLKPNVKPNDRVIIFLAGHGVTKGTGADAKGYFLCTDVNGLTTKALEDSAVPLKELSNRLSQLPASEFILFIDACREDPTPGRAAKPNQLSDVLSRGLQVLPQNSDKPATVVAFYACSIGQRAYEDAKLKHGVFTYWLLEGLRKGPVPETDGAVHMSRLATYTRQQVGEWATKAFGATRGAKLSTEDEEEVVTQTPEIVVPVSPPLLKDPEPIVLMRVKRAVQSAPIEPDSPKLVISTMPDNARITVNGKVIGTSPIIADVPEGGDCKVRVEAAGYESEERSLKALNGYHLQISLRLKPGARSVGKPADEQTSTLYQKALDAETRQNWEVAMAGYNIVRQSDPKFASAYERLAYLQQRRGAKKEAAETLAELVRQLPSAHNYSLLARAYATQVIKATSADQTSTTPEPKKKKGGILGGLFGKKEPKTANKSAVDPNAILALNAANQAVKLDAKSAEAHLARGFALVAADQAGNNQNEAQKAFGTAVFLDKNDAANQYGLGYGRRIYALLKDDDREEELKSAIEAQHNALKLRPDFYEAHLELAFCHHLLGDNATAMRHYEMANSYRGAATDKDEIAAANVALAALHRQEAQNTEGDEKKDHEQAADGYMEDGKEISPDLSRAMMILGHVGLSTQLTDFLPAEITRWMDPKGAIETEIRNKVPGVPGIGLPF